jgi:hypothetical protein
MTWKPAIAVTLSSVLLAATTALAQAPGGSSGGSGSPGSSGGGAMTPTTPTTPGNNPCPPGQVMEGTTCAPARVNPSQSTPSQSMEQRDKSMEKKSMEKMDKRMGSGSDRIGSAAGNGRMDREQVKRIQEALKDKGYDPGEIDGAMGPRTSAALREFQQAEGLRVTGRLDSDTRSKLGI